MSLLQSFVRYSVSLHCTSASYHPALSSFLPKSYPCSIPGDFRIQHTVMASVRLSYGEDLQMDWDGRGRLLVMVGALPDTAALQPGPYKVSLVLRQSGFLWWEKNSSLPSPYAPGGRNRPLLFMRD